MKPVIYAANIAEDQLGLDESELPYVQAVRKAAAQEGAEVLVISAQIEEEIAQMERTKRPNSWRSWASRRAVWTAWCRPATGCWA